MKHDLDIKFTGIELLADSRIILFDKDSTKYLNKREFKFYNWDLLFSVLGPNDTQGEIEKKLDERIKILKSIMALKSKPVG